MSNYLPVSGSVSTSYTGSIRGSMTFGSGILATQSYRSWDQHTLQQKVKDAQEYLAFLKENQRKLREIIG